MMGLLDSYVRPIVAAYPSSATAQTLGTMLHSICTMNATLLGVLRTAAAEGRLGEAFCAHGSDMLRVHMVRASGGCWALGICLESAPP